MTKKRKEPEFAVSGSFGGVQGAVRLGSDGKIELQFGIDKIRRKKNGRDKGAKPRG
jgi:hypothetical protein